MDKRQWKRLKQNVAWKWYFWLVVILIILDVTNSWLLEYYLLFFYLAVLFLLVDILMALRDD